jgi:hypothetical protein
MMKRTEFEERQLQERIRDAADGRHGLVTAIESGERVYYDDIFERDHGPAAVKGRAREAQSRAQRRGRSR